MEAAEKSSNIEPGEHLVWKVKGVAKFFCSISYSFYGLKGGTWVQDKASPSFMLILMMVTMRMWRR